MFRLLILGCPLLGSPAFAQTTEAVQVSKDEDSYQRHAEDKPLAAWRTNLLEHAFQAGSAMPVHPHLKSRSKAQEKVLVASLELDQPVRARRYAEGIENWRRGAALADIARYCIEQGTQAGVDELLGEAERASENPAGVGEQQWRRNTIITKIAQARWARGQAEKARQAVKELGGEEADKLAAQTLDTLEAGAITEDGFQGRIDNLRKLAQSAGFEARKTGLQTCVDLYRRFYEDKSKRAKILVTVEDLWDKQPVVTRLNTLFQLALISLDEGDSKTAEGTLERAQGLYDSIPWKAEFGVPWLGQIAAMYARVGKHEAAQRRIAEALELFEKNKKEILSIDHCEALLPLAEASYLAGSKDQALALYARALEAGAANPNARPRADDLIAVAISMARTDCEPSGALADRIGEIVAGLEDPW